MEKKELKEKIEKKDNNVLIVTVLVVIIIALLLLINFVLNIFNSNIDKESDIRAVKKILGTKYNAIKCIDSNCKYVVTTSGDETKKTTYNVYDLNGRRVAYYNIDYSKNDNKQTEIINASNNFIITRTLNEKKYLYVLRNTKGKAKYSSNERINILSDKLAVIKVDSKYNIVDKNGKIIIDNVSKYNSYYDGKYNVITKNAKNSIINESGKTLLKNYSISEEIKNNDKVEFLIIKNEKTEKYYYFSIKSSKKIGNSFENYSFNDFDQIIITKKENKKEVKYILNNNGSQEKYKKDLDLTYESITKKIDSDTYYIYRYGISDSNQKYILVNNKKDNNFGVLNTKNKKFKKMFDYKTTASLSGALVSEIDGTNILRITCSKYYCEENKNIIYDISDNKIIYEDKNDNAVISEFTLYNNNYKVIKYSYSSSNKEFAGKSYLYDNKNNIVNSSDNQIAIIDSTRKLGTSKNNNLLLYSIKNKKFINNDNSLASKVILLDKDFYRFIDSKDMINVYNSKGEKQINISSDSYITYTNSYIIYIDNNVVKMFNAKNNKTKKYKLKNNDKLNDENGDITSPYRGVFFVNNSTTKTVKVINGKGRTIKKIRNVELSTVEKKSDGSALIFVKTFDKNTDVYGLYIAR